MLSKYYRYIALIKLLSLVTGILIFIFNFFGDKQEGEISLGEKEYVYILDVSNSMNVEDCIGKYGIPLSRLEMSKIIINEFLTKYPKQKHGLIIFSKESNFYIPPTYDLETFRTYLSGINTSTIPYGGTNIISGIKDFTSLSSKDYYGILISDLGDQNDTQNQINKTNQLLKSGKINNIKVIGVGTTKGDYVKYSNGNYIEKFGNKIIDIRNDNLGDYLSKSFGTKYGKIENLNETNLIINNSAISLTKRIDDNKNILNIIALIMIIIGL